MRGRWELADEQWEKIEPVLRPAQRADNRGRPWHDTRAVLNGVLWVLGTGAVARVAGEVSALPDLSSLVSAVGPQWQVGEDIANAGAAFVSASQLNLDDAFVDATFASAKKRPCRWSTRRGKGTKIIAIAADSSLPLAVSVDSASPAECRLVEQVLAGNFLDELPARLIGDKAYDSDALDELAEEYGIEMIAPNWRKRGKTQDGRALPRYRPPLEGGTIVRLAAQLSPAGYALGVPHRELPWLRAAWLSSLAAAPHLSHAMPHVGLLGEDRCSDTLSS